MSLSLTLTAIGAVASLLSAGLVVLTYLWSRIPSAVETETWLENRMVRTTFKGHTGEFKVLQVRVYEESGFSALISRHLRFSPEGMTVVLGDIADSGGIWWGPEDFEDYCKEFGAEGEYETYEKETPVQVEIRLGTMDRREVHRFIDLITSLKTENDSE